jgi:hypothetical protein
MTTPRWNDPKAVQAAIQRNRENRRGDPNWRDWEEVSNPTGEEPGGSNEPTPSSRYTTDRSAAQKVTDEKVLAATLAWDRRGRHTRRRTKMKQYLAVALILICVWVVASVSIRIFGILVLGLQNTEMSVGVVSALAVVAVAVWIWRDDLF